MSEKCVNDKKGSHETVCKELTELYQRKNHDYGDSFHKGYQEYGMLMPIIRLEDKLDRLKSLTLGREAKVKDESVRDTLLDLANYAIMTIMELEEADDIIMMIQTAPTINSQVNIPLTLEELRGMEGRIVYCTPLNDWVKVTKIGILFFGTADYKSWSDIIADYGKIWMAYRRKPEEEHHGEE